MSFLKKLWQGIANLFKGLRIKSKVWVHLAVTVVQKLKDITDSPVPDVIAAIIPGEADDKIKDKIREWVPKVLLQLNMMEVIVGIEDPNEQMQAILAKIKFSSKETRNIFWHGLASLLLEKFSDGKFDWKDAIAVSQYYYDHILDTNDAPTPQTVAQVLAAEDTDEDGDD